MSNNQIIQKQVNVSISLKGCKCDGFNFTEFGETNTKVIDFNKFRFDFNLAMNIDAGIKSAIIVINSILHSNDEGAPGAIANLKSITTFLIINFDEVAIDTPNGKAIPEEVLPLLIGTSISSLRGMYAVKLQDTIYENAVIPIIDATQFLPKKPSFVG